MMIFEWLTGKAFGLAKGLWLLIAIFLAMGLVVGIAHIWLDKTIETAANSGASLERERAATATIDNVRKANEAAETVRRDPAAARSDCLQDARNPADC